MGHTTKPAGDVAVSTDRACPIVAIAEEIGRLVITLQETQASIVATDDAALRALLSAREAAIGKRMGVLEEAALALRPRSAGGALFLAALLKGCIDGDEIDEARAEILAGAAEAVASWIEAEAGIRRRDLAAGFYSADYSDRSQEPAP